MPEADPTPENPSEAPAAGGSPGLQRRWLINLSLLAVIGALAGIALHRAGQDKDETGAALTTLPADSITRIMLERPDHPSIRLEKNGKAWTLASPVHARANAFNVDNLLRLLSARRTTQFPAIPAELGKFGLDNPQVRVRFNNDEFAFGALHPLNNQIYVLYQKNVALIPGHFLGAAIYPYNHFIDGHLFETDRQLTAIKLSDFSVKQVKGVWQRIPANKKLTSDRINEFAAEWQNASALSVEKYSGTAALGEIRITAQHQNRSERLALGVLAYKPEFVLLRLDEHLEYHFTEDTGKRLLHLNE